jgi:hypothetical protein
MPIVIVVINLSALPAFEARVGAASCERHSQAIQADEMAYIAKPT